MAIPGTDCDRERMFAFGDRLCWAGELVGRSEQGVDDDVPSVPVFRLVTDDQTRSKMANGRTNREHTQDRLTCACQKIHGLRTQMVAVRDLLAIRVKRPCEDEDVVDRSFESRVRSVVAERHVQDRVGYLLRPHGEIPFHGKLATKWRSIRILPLDISSLLLPFGKEPRTWV